MTPIESVLILPSQTRFVSPALAFIRAAAASCGFSGSALDDIEVATEEALTNVIKHAFEGNPDETFKLSVRFTEADFSITIYEKGIPFSPDKVAEFTPEKLQSTLESDGLGVFLMKNMMDDVRFENLGREGKSLTLIKHIKKSPTTAAFENGGNELLAKGRLDTAPRDISYVIRPFMPEDALEITRCAYKTYGYTYEPYIYYPEQIIEMNHVGTLRSFVAAAKSTGEVIGHIALKYKNTTDCIAEIGVAFVKPDYRNLGIFNSLIQYCNEKAVEFGLYGIFARAVTSHVGSVKAFTNIGYHACGVLLGLFPDDVDFKALTGKIKQKESGLLLYRPVVETCDRTIYPPLRYQDKILNIFKTCNVSAHAVEGSSEFVCGQNQITVEVIPVLNIADIVVSAFASDIMHELKLTIHELCLKHVDVIFLHLDLENPVTSFVAQQLEQAGFFFSGVLPFGLNNKHELILQYMNNLAINYDIIKPYSPSAMELLEYVRSCDTNRAI